MSGEYVMPKETLMQRLESDGRLWRQAYEEGHLDGQVSALRGVADGIRFPDAWILFRRPDGSGVTVPDLLREMANQIEEADR